MNIKRGEVWLAALDPTVGSEIQKTRPVVVVSNDVNNANNSVVSVVPITSNVARILSFEVFIPAGVANLSKDSKAKTDQIRTLDKSRLVKRYGALPMEYSQQLNAALKLHLALS